MNVFETINFFLKEAFVDNKIENNEYIGMEPASQNLCQSV